MGKRILRVLFYLLVIGYAIISIGPFLWSVITSLKPTSEINNLAIDLSKLSFKNYIFLWKKFPFERWMLNSIWVALVVTFGNLLLIQWQDMHLQE
ncbi:hypothetical protein PL321_00680 [Caloramator sp. mosi_1]|uniref:hypothetical protein n=1 Tax=Caloramator sp. mosi_1 TaxID=3023090 RepID=UPI0023625DC6|nr:hypothetical protein [Caloramator sp. mosi_1]WDC84385.1 hypothetical protein PL321_00680 [Caloramator sp. mosi_1]